MTPPPDSPARPADAAPITVEVNGEPRVVEAGSDLAELIDALGLTERKLAIAIDRAVIPRTRYAGHALENGNRIEILEAVGGG